MLIGIDASRAFLKERTGIEEYCYQVIKNLRGKLDGHEVVLYLRNYQSVDFEIPEKWKIKKINFPRLWTQVGLSFEMWKNPAGILFVPAHTVPLFHPENTVVTVHGLEYEFVPEAYSFWERLYMRWSIKNSCRWANKIISVSKNTRKDLIDLYKVPDNKIKVVYEGYNNLDSHNSQLDTGIGKNSYGLQVTSYGSYLLFIGRIEERKNIIGIIKTFEVLKEKFKIPHKLVLAGRMGYGFEKIEKYLDASEWKNEIVLTGFVSEEEKWKLLGSADVFMFPTFYEGFGIPILEAQSMGVPVVCSNISSLIEIAAGSAVLVDPNEPELISDKTNVLLKEEPYRKEIIRKGYENAKRFSWDKCAEEISHVILSQLKAD